MMCLSEQVESARKRLDILDNLHCAVGQAIEDAHSALRALELSLQGQADLALSAVDSDQDGHRPGGAPQVDGAAGMQG